eukprot:gene18272-34988_t
MSGWPPDDPLRVNFEAFRSVAKEEGDSVLDSLCSALDAYLRQRDEKRVDEPTLDLNLMRENELKAMMKQGNEDAQQQNLESGFLGGSSYFAIIGWFLCAIGTLAVGGDTMLRLMTYTGGGHLKSCPVATQLAYSSTAEYNMSSVQQEPGPARSHWQHTCHINTGETAHLQEATYGGGFLAADFKLSSVRQSPSSS